MKYTLSTIYTTFILLFVSLFFVSTGFLQLSKYILLLITSYVLYLNVRGEHKITKNYHFIFLSLVVIYVLFRSMEIEGLYLGLNVLLLIASLVGLCIVGSKKAYLRLSKKTQNVPSKNEGSSKKFAKKVAKKSSAKKVTKKTAKNVADKKSVKKSSAKKVTKKSSAKKVAKKSSAKNVADKKVAKKSSAKNVADKKSVKKSSSKSSSAKKVTKKSAAKKVAKKSSSKKVTKKSAKDSSKKK